MGGSSILAIRIGSIKLIVTRGLHISLHDILFIPSETVHLISVSVLCTETHCSVHFDDATCWVTTHNGAHILSVTMSANHHYSITGGQLSAAHILLVQSLSMLHTWHGRLGHANYRAVYNLARGGHATGMPIDLSVTPGSYANCIFGNQKWSSVPQTQQGTRAIRKLGIVHVDLLEHPEHMLSLRNKYMLNIINDFSSYTWSISLTTKSDAYKAFMDWKHAQKFETSLHVRIYCSDNGKFKCAELQEWLLSQGTYNHSQHHILYVCSE